MSGKNSPSVENADIICMNLDLVTLYQATSCLNRYSYCSSVSILWCILYLENIKYSGQRLDFVFVG